MTPGLVRATTGGSIGEGVAGVAALALAIIGLLGFYPGMMLSIAVIAIGAAFVFEATAIAERIAGLLSATRARAGGGFLAMSGGSSAEFLAGLGGIALGILSLLGVMPAVLIPSAAILFGAALLIGSTSAARLNNLGIISSEQEGSAMHDVALEAASAGAGAQMLAGLSAITLGILALVGYPWVALSLVAMLTLGATNLLGGFGMSSRLLHRGTTRSYETTRRYEA
jgi:hypothetical protein